MDNRSEERIENHIRFFVHVSECETEPDLVGNSITCEGIDFSAHGMQLKTEDVLPVATLLNITISIKDPYSMYLLSGEIRWARATQNGAFMGILLKNDEGTDCEAWAESFSDSFASD